jgi:hypothetical protein
VIAIDEKQVLVWCVGESRQPVREADDDLLDAASIAGHKASIETDAKGLGPRV